VGERLRASGVPVIEFRASIIIGSGSLSFEMIRALVERLPVMVTPRWVRVQAQPIAVTDVLAYLRAALSLEINGSVILEIGGPDRVSYGDLMREYARQRGLRRWMIPVPLLTPRLSSLWLGLVTPLYARVLRLGFVIEQVVLFAGVFGQVEHFVGVFLPVLNELVRGGAHAEMRGGVVTSRRVVVAEVKRRGPVRGRFATWPREPSKRLNIGTPFRCEYCPVNSVARLGGQMELATNELAKRVPSFASRSICGVAFTFEP
jgi:hypothetical protein